MTWCQGAPLNTCLFCLPNPICPPHQPFQSTFQISAVRSIFDLAGGNITPPLLQADWPSANITDSPCTDQTNHCSLCVVSCVYFARPAPLALVQLEFTVPVQSERPTPDSWEKTHSWFHVFISPPSLIGSGPTWVDSPSRIGTHISWVRGKNPLILKKKAERNKQSPGKKKIPWQNHDLLENSRQLLQKSFISKKNAITYMKSLKNTNPLKLSIPEKIQIPGKNHDPPPIFF